jgi:hypothetical protein
MDDGHEGVDDDPHDVVMSMASNPPFKREKVVRKQPPKQRSVTPQFRLAYGGGKIL